MSLMMLVQWFGAFCVFIGFTANAQGWLDRTDRRYLILNWVGAAALAWSAYSAAQWAFMGLNLFWGAVAFRSLMRRNTGGDENGGSAANV